MPEMVIQRQIAEHQKAKSRNLKHALWLSSSCRLGSGSPDPAVGEGEATRALAAM